MKNILGLSMVLMMACAGCQSRLMPSVAPVTDQPLPTPAPGYSGPAAPDAMPIPEDRKMPVDKDLKVSGVPLAWEEYPKNWDEPWCDPASFDIGEFYCQGGKLQMEAKEIDNLAQNRTAILGILSFRRKYA